MNSPALSALRGFGLPLILFLTAGTGDGAPISTSGDWPQWRGPNRDGISTESAWKSEGVELWRKPVGRGYSTVSVHAGRLFTMGFDEEHERDTIWCLDAVTGKEIWKHQYAAKIWNFLHAGGTLTTPSVDGDVVYTLNREGRFFCFAAADGEVHWARDLMQEELELEHPKWGFAASPLVLSDALVLNVGRVIAMDKKTGETKWVTAKNYGHAYSTPKDFELDGKPCLAVFNSTGFVALDRRDGSELYFHEWKTMYEINAASPVVADDTVFISSGLNRGCALLKLAGDAPEVVWESKAMRNKMSGCVLLDGHLYGIDEGALKCVALDGEEKWRERGLKDGALLVAGDRLIVMSSEGELVVAAAEPDAYTELSRAKVLEGGVFWTTPVLTEGLIYCRSSEGELVCRDHRDGAKETR